MLGKKCMSIILFETSKADTCNRIQGCIETIDIGVDIFIVVPQLIA